MGRSLIVDLNGTFGYLLRGLLRGEGHQATLAGSLEEMSSGLRLSYYDAVFMGEVPDAVLDILAEVDGLRLIQIGTSIGIEDFCDDVLERPLRLNRLSKLAGEVLVGGQRRVHRRRAVQLSVQLDQGGRRVSGHVTDLAMGGLQLALAADPELDVERPVTTRLDLPDEQIGLETRVIYSQPTEGGVLLGLGFEELGNPVAGRLRNYLLCA